MSDIGAFLMSCADTEEREARDAQGAADWSTDPEVGGLYDAINVLHARHDPVRVLADCAALRAVATFLDPTDAPPGEGRYVAEQTLRILAQPFKGRPGWDETWKLP